MAAMSSAEKVARSSALKALSWLAVSLAICAGVNDSDCSVLRPPSWVADRAATCVEARLDTSSVDSAVIWSRVRPVIERGAIALFGPTDQKPGAVGPVCAAARQRQDRGWFVGPKSLTDFLGEGLQARAVAGADARVFRLDERAVGDAEGAGRAIQRSTRRQGQGHEDAEQA